MNPTYFPVDESRLVALVVDPATTSQQWAVDAACAGLPGGLDAYFPDDGEAPSVEAMSRCAACPVAAECLATALIHESQTSYREGWWGGLGLDERSRIAEDLGIVTQPVELDICGPAEFARQLRSSGRTVASIAMELGCTERTVYRYLAAPAA